MFLLSLGASKQAINIPPLRSHFCLHHDDNDDGDDDGDYGDDDDDDVDDDDDDDDPVKFSIPVVPFAEIFNS